MKTLNLYVLKNFLLTFFAGLGILTFGMAGARLIKVFEYISSGVPVGNTLLFLLYVMPVVLSLTIPWASLVSVMLVFGRLSADNEITAMRASGISILQIVAPIIVFAFLISCFCFYLHMELAPKYMGRARELVKRVLVDQPMAIFQPGIPVKYGDLNIYIGSKENNIIRDIQVYRMGKSGRWEQDVTAQKGYVTVDKEKQELNIVLERATISSVESKNDVVTTTGRELVISIDYGETFTRERLVKKPKFLTTKELLARISMSKKQGLSTTDMEVEFNNRIALALSPIAFLLLGMPLAIRTSRRETSIGLFLSVLLAGIYFGAVLLTEVVKDVDKLYPQYFIWLAPFLYQLFGAVYIFKVAKR